MLVLLLLLQDDPGAHFARGRELRQQGLLEEAIDEFEKAGTAPVVLIELASTYEKVDRCQAALDTWQKVLGSELSEEQRAQIAQRMQAQRWRLSHNECKDGPKKVAAEPVLGRRGRRRREPAPEPEGPREHHAWGLGFRVGFVMGRIGASDELTGASAGSTPIEDFGGINFRLALQIPLARTADHAPLLQLEPFFSLSYYGFTTPIVLVDTGGTQLTTINGGHAMMPLFGAAARFSIPLSGRAYLAPALGFGVGLQNIAIDTDQCHLSTSPASAVMTFDLPIRFETEPHHALYFSPASLFVIFPPGGEGDTIDLMCFGLPGGGTNTSKAIYKLDSTKLNYAVDVGYMYQF